jgi:hypothetical protein
MVILLATEARKVSISDVSSLNRAVRYRKTLSGLKGL